MYLKCGIYHLYILSSFVCKIYHIFLLFLFFASKSLVFPCGSIRSHRPMAGPPKNHQVVVIWVPRTSPLWGRCNPETPKLGGCWCTYGCWTENSGVFPPPYFLETPKLADEMFSTMEMAIKIRVHRLIHPGEMWSNPICVWGCSRRPVQKRNSRSRSLLANSIASCAIFTAWAW